MKKVFISLIILIAVQQTLTAQEKRDTIIRNEILNEVVVTAKLPTVEVSPGKMSYLLDATITQKNGTIYDMLSTLPGVSISNDGNVTLYGKSGATLLVDGKPTYLSGTDLVNMLKSLPASNSDKIDLISQPTSKYDAAGNMGIIDIRTRKIKLRGYNASIYTSGNPGLNKSGYIGTSMNIRKGKVNFFSNYSYYHGTNIIDMVIYRPYKELNGDMQEYSYRKRNQNSHFLRLGFDYDITPRTTWGASLKGNYANQNERSKLKDIILNSDYINNTWGTLHYVNQDLYATTYLTHKLNGEDRDISASADYYVYDTSRRQHIYNDLSDPLLGNMNGIVHVFSGKADLRYAINENWKLSGGIKSAFVNLHNKAGYMRPYNDNEWKYDESMGSRFTYDENINAAYIQSEHKIGNIQLSLGLRLEGTHVKGKLSGNSEQADSLFTSSYVNLFPTVGAQYNFKSGNAIQLTYGRRINRPNYGDLNPFTYRFNDFLADAGNTKLQPSFANNIELSFVHKNNWQIVGFYSHTSDAIVKTFQIQDDGRLFATPDNMANATQAGIRIHLPSLSPFEWWNTNATITGAYCYFRWQDLHDMMKNERFVPVVNLMNQFKISSIWSAEVNFDYWGRLIAGQATVKSRSRVNLAVQKTILKGMGTISLFAKDIFNGNIEKASSDLYYGHAVANSDYKERMVGVSLSLRFKKGVKAEEKNKNNDIDEMKRVNL